jgi:hypothetical protein
VNPPLSTRYRFVVPKALSPEPYLVTHEDGRIQWQGRGWRWFYYRLRVCDEQGVELARLRSAGHWWWLWGTWKFELLGSDGRIALISESGGHRAGLYRTSLTNGPEMTIRWEGNGCTFTQDEHTIARLSERRQSSTRRPNYDLELAEGIDALPLVGTCMVIDLHRRQVLKGP